jgi:GDSL-like lipase/acylhydrolase family protein
VKVALEGDSLVEGRPGPRGDLAYWVRWELRRLHVSVGAGGYVAAHANGFTTGPGGDVRSFPWTYSPGWILEGLGLSPPSPFGANGRMSLTTSRAATARARLSGNRFAVLFARSPDAGAFEVSVDGVHTLVNARGAVTDGSGLVWLRAPSPVPRVSHVVVEGPRSGVLRFTGVLARSAVRGERTQVEVSSLGQACACATDPLPPTRLQALEALRPDISVIMLGTNGEGRFLESGDERIPTGYLQGLEKRARVARMHGGRCVIVSHPPNQRPAALQAKFRALARKAAQAGRCRFEPVFDGIWNGDTSARLGLTADGIHPTPPGYRRMSARLARLIIRLAGPLP